jgi:hypothetical protein
MKKNGDKYKTEETHKRQDSKKQANEKSGDGGENGVQGVRLRNIEALILNN